MGAFLDPVSLFSQRTNRIFSHVELDSTTVLIVYDKYGATDGNVYIREIDYSTTTPSVGEEQTVWSGTWADFSGHASNTLAPFRFPLIKLTSTLCAYNFAAGTSAYVQKYLKLVKSGSTWTGTLVNISTTNTYSTSTFWASKEQWVANRLNDTTFFWMVSYSTASYIHEENVDTQTHTQRFSANFSIQTTSIAYTNPMFIEVESNKHLLVYANTSGFYNARILTISGSTYNMSAASGPTNSIESGSYLPAYAWLVKRSTGDIKCLIGRGWRQFDIAVSGSTITWSGTLTNRDVADSTNGYLSGYCPIDSTHDLWMNYSSDTYDRLEYYNTTSNSYESVVINSMLGPTGTTGILENVIKNTTIPAAIYRDSSDYTIRTIMYDDSKTASLDVNVATYGERNSIYLQKDSNTLLDIYIKDSDITKLCIREIDVTTPKSPVFGTEQILISGLPASTSVGGAITSTWIPNSLIKTGTNSYSYTWITYNASGQYGVRFANITESSGTYTCNYHTNILNDATITSTTSFRLAYWGSGKYLIQHYHTQGSYIKDWYSIVTDSGSAFSASAWNQGIAGQAVSNSTNAHLIRLEDDFALMSYDITSTSPRMRIVWNNSGSIAYGASVDLTTSNYPIVGQIRLVGSEIWVIYRNSTWFLQKYTYNTTDKTISTNGSAISLSLLNSSNTLMYGFWTDGSTKIATIDSEYVYKTLNLDNTGLLTLDRFVRYNSPTMKNSFDKMIEKDGTLITALNRSSTFTYANTIVAYKIESSTPVFEYVSSGTLSLSSTSVCDTPKEYSSSGSLSLDSISETERFSLSYDYESTGNLELDSTSITSRETASYNCDTTGNLSLDSISIYNQERSIIYSGSLELSSASFFDQDRTINSIGSIELNSSILSTIDQNKISSGSLDLNSSSVYNKTLSLNFVSNGNLGLNSISTKRKFSNSFSGQIANVSVFNITSSDVQSIDASATEQLVVYYTGSDWTWQLHNISTTTPSFISAGNLGVSQSGVLPINGLVKHSSSVFAFYFVYNYDLYGVKLNRVGNEFNLVSYSRVDTSELFFTPATTFPINDTTVGFIQDADLVSLKWNGNNLEIESWIDLGVNSPNVPGEHTVENIGNNTFLIQGTTGLFEPRIFTTWYDSGAWNFKNSLTSNYIALGPTGNYDRVAEYPLKATKKDDGSIHVYYNYCAGVGGPYSTRVTKYTLSNWYDLTSVGTNTIRSGNSYLSGCENYSNDIDILFFSNGIYSYTYSTNTLTLLDNISFSTSDYEQNSFKKSSRIVTVYHTGTVLRASYFGVTPASASISTTGSMYLDSVSEYDKAFTTSGTLGLSSISSNYFYTDFEFNKSGSISLSSDSSYYKQTSFYKTTSGTLSLSSDSSSYYKKDYLLTPSGTLSLSSTSVLTNDRSWISDSSLALDSDSSIDWTSDYSLDTEGGLKLHSSSTIQEGEQLISDALLAISANAEVDWISNWTKSSDSFLELSSISTLSMDFSFIKDSSLELSSESIYNNLPAWSLDTSGSLELSSDSVITVDYATISSGSIEVDSRSVIDWKADWSKTSEGSLELSSSSLFNFLRSWSYNPRGELNINSSSQFNYQTFDNWNYSSLGSLELASEVVYDFSAGFDFITHGDINIDSFAESLWTAIFDKTTSGTFSLSSTSEYYYRKIQPVWEYTSTGALIVSSVSRYSEGSTNVQLVYFKTPITTERNLFTNITNEVELETKITNQVEINIQMLDTILEENKKE